MPKIRVGFCCRHAGLIRLLVDLWEGDFDVRLKSRYAAARKGRTPPWKGDEQIIISTLHHVDMLNAEEIEGVKKEHGAHVIDRLPIEVIDTRYDGSTPVIMYCTDPVLPAVKKRAAIWNNESWFHPIGAENCYPPEQFIGHVEKYIPFAMHPPYYPAYNGRIPQALIVQRHPLDRLNAIMPRMDQPPASSIEEFMSGVPYHHARDPNFDRFVRNYSDHRVLFYWSDSPYTIVLFEAMTAGIPIVALRSPADGPVDPLMKYLPAGSIFTDPAAAREKLKEYIQNPAPARVEYPSCRHFNDIRQEWLETITNIVGGG